MAQARGMLEETEHPIVLDLGLPDGYGADLIKELREKHPKPRRSSSALASTALT